MSSLAKSINSEICQLLITSYLVVKCGSYWAIVLMSRVFANGPGGRGSIPSRVIPKTQKMVLDAAWLNTQHYKVRIKGKVEHSTERSNAPYISV